MTEVESPQANHDQLRVQDLLKDSFMERGNHRYTPEYKARFDAAVDALSDEEIAEALRQNMPIEYLNAKLRERTVIVHLTPIDPDSLFPEPAHKRARRARPIPHSLAMRIIELGADPSRVDEKAGDMVELFDRTVARHGISAAQVGLWFNALQIAGCGLFLRALDWAGRLLLIRALWRSLNL